MLRNFLELAADWNTKTGRRPAAERAAVKAPPAATSASAHRTPPRRAAH
jgi:hypothetical protein